MSAAAIVWLRRDLRLADNAAFEAACAGGAAAIPVFVWAPEEESPWEPGAASRWWLHQSLRALDASLTQRGSRLVIRRGPTGETLAALAAECGAGAVVWNRGYEARDGAVETALRARGIAVRTFAGNLLFEPGSIRNSTGQPFQVFTAFWKACLRAPEPAAPTPAPARIAAPERWPASLPLDDLALAPRVDWAGGLRESWQPGEAGAQRLLQRFLAEGADRYAIERDLPAIAGTSRLSPHLHFGELSARQIWHRARFAEPFVRQLAWREFAHHLLFHFPRTAREPLRTEFARFPWRTNARWLEAWQRGRTGYPLVDAGMRELWHTGWMHNRVRMVVASFLVKHLLTGWREGAAWFWDTLVDADLANNTLGWQWCAGCGADAAPYFRIFNPVMQGEKFDPEGTYVRRWVPELERVPAAWIHHPWEAPPMALAEAGIELGRDYPPPLVEPRAARQRALDAFARLRS